MNFRASILSALLLLAVASSACGEEDSDAGGNLVVARPFVCQPGTRFKVDCNTCRCGNVPGMLGACTRINCLIKEGQCIPKTYFMYNGKLCDCPVSGIRTESDCFAGFE